MILIKTAIFTVVVPGTVTILIPYWLLSTRPTPTLSQIGISRYFGLLPISVGTLIYLWCAWDFTFAGRGTPAPIDSPKALVVRGLYRYVRNPMYVGVLAILIGEALFFESRRLLEYAVIVFTFFYLFVILYEEPVLKRKFGESYERYRQTVPRWLPLKIR